MTPDFKGWVAPNGAVVTANGWHDERQGLVWVDFDRPPYAQTQNTGGFVFKSNGAHYYREIGTLSPAIDPAKTYKYGRLRVTIMSTQACAPRPVVVMTKSGTILGVSPRDLKEIK